MPDSYNVDELYKTPKQKLEEGSVPAFGNTFDTGYSGARVVDQLRNYGAGTRTVRVQVGQDIQTAIDKVNEDGGGVVSLQNGTHRPKANIILYSNVILKGENTGSSIIDFELGSYSVLFEGTAPYSTGTVSVSNGGTTVTGSGTSWSANVVAGQSILLGGFWYPIANVGGNTTITIGIPYAGVALSGATYVIAYPITESRLEDMTLKNSATNALDMRYAQECFVERLNIQSSANGMRVRDSSSLTIPEMNFVANNTHFTFENVHYTQFYGNGAVDALTGATGRFTNCTVISLSDTYILNSAGVGLQFTSCSDCKIDGAASIENGSHGVEFVSGNSNITISDFAAENNAGDGIKLTATTDNCFISTSTFANNGGYGINIAASTSDETIIIGNDFNANTSGAINDLGTDTMIIGNTPQSVQTGVYDFGGATSFEIPNSTNPTVNANGEIAVDTSVADFSHGILKYYGGEELGVVAMPIAQFTSPTDGYVVKYNATNDEFELGGAGTSEIILLPRDGSPTTTSGCASVALAQVNITTTLGVTYSLDLESSSTQYAERTSSLTGFPSGSSNKSIEAWVKFESLPTGGADMMIVDGGDNATNNGEFNLAVKESGGSIYGFVDKYNAAVTGTVALGFTTGVWYHYAVRYNGTNFQWVVDGVQVDSAAAGTVTSSITIAGVGRRSSTAGGGYFDGKVSLVRFWAESRSDSQLFANRFSILGSTTNLSAEWTLDNVYTDNSGNGNTLTAGNSPVFATDPPNDVTDFRDVTVFDFDASSDENAVWQVVLPENYAGGTVTAQFYWIANSSSTNNVVWGVQGSSFGDSDSLDAAWGTAQTVTDANNAQNDVNISSATSAITISGTPLAGELAMFRVYRDADNASDNLAADARLVAVRINF